MLGLNDNGQLSATAVTGNPGTALTRLGNSMIPFVKSMMIE